MDDRKTATFTVRIHPDSDGLWAEVLELPGCFAAGSDLDELRESLAEGVSLYLSDEDTPVTARLIDGNDDVIDERREFQLCGS